MNYGVGDIAVVIANISAHGFKMGTEVVITRVISSTELIAENNDEWWWVDPKELRLLSHQTPRSTMEALADIAYIAGENAYYSGDSRRDISSFIEWAEEF